MSNHIYFSPFPNGFRPQIGVISRVISCPSCISTALFRSRSSHARSRGSIQMQRCPAADTTGSHSSLSVSTGCPCYWTKTAKNMCANASVRVYLQVSWFIYSLGTPHFANTPTLNIVGYISIYIYIYVDIYIYIYLYSSIFYKNIPYVSHLLLVVPKHICMGEMESGKHRNKTYKMMKMFTSHHIWWMKPIISRCMIFLLVFIYYFHPNISHLYSRLYPIDIPFVSHVLPHIYPMLYPIYIQWYSHQYRIYRWCSIINHIYI